MILPQRYSIISLYKKSLKGDRYMTVKPKFFDSFKCTASECTDTCCAGWEIYVDGDTAEYYTALDGEVGEYIRENLSVCEDGILLCREGEKCPFLRHDKLCEIILKLGEDSICEICREHPRFYSTDINLTEAGIGLCCPEATRLWLDSPTEFVFNEDGYPLTEDEKNKLGRQMFIIEYLVSGERTLGEKLAELLGENYDDELYEKLRELYSKLEVLDSDFPKRFSEFIEATDDARFSRLASYFVFRYYFELGEELCLKFTAASLVMVASMSGELKTAAKDYSKEVEYDTDNLDMIYSFLENCDCLGGLCKKVFLK